MWQRVVCTTLALVAMEARAAPQVLYLDSGERLVGEVLPESSAQTVVLKSALLGQLQVARERVLQIEAYAVQESSAVPASATGAAESVPEILAPPPVESQSEAGLWLSLKEYRALQEMQDWVTRFSEIETPESWRGDLRIGLNLSDGDNKWEENYARGKLEIEPVGTANFYRLSGSYIYRKTEHDNGDTVKSTDRYDGEFVYRRTFSEDWFVQNALSLRVDQIKGIDRELKELIGLGYKYKIRDGVELLFGAGAGVRQLRADFQDNYLGETPVMNAFQELSWRLSPRVRLSQEFDYNLNPELPEQYSYTLSASLRFRLTDLLGFEFSFFKDFDSDVGNGEVKKDIRWQNALVVYF